MALRARLSHRPAVHRRRPAPRRPLALVALFALLALSAAGCARAPREPGGPVTLAARHAEARVRREAALGALRADLVLRLDGRATGRLPAFAATLALAAPERARLQAHALLGVAFEALARGDSLVVRVPAERAAFVLGGAGESLGAARPVEFVGRALAATWRPSPEAWRDARADSAGWTLAWREGADSLELALDERARPRAATLRRGAAVVRVGYDEWARVRGQEFPVALSVRDEAGWVRARVAIEDLRFAARAEESWFDWRIPEGARALTWREVRDLLRREVEQP